MGPCSYYINNKYQQYQPINHHIYRFNKHTNRASLRRWSAAVPVLYLKNNDNNIFHDIVPLG